MRRCFFKKRQLGTRDPEVNGCNLRIKALNFFHVYTIMRGENSIIALKNDDGKWIIDEN